MPIREFWAMDFLVFKRRDRKKQTETARNGAPIRNHFYLNLCDGINVLIGENGVGKTSILKMLYAACEWSKKRKLSPKSPLPPTLCGRFRHLPVTGVPPVFHGL